jgi:hypothetical protein
MAVSVLSLRRLFIGEMTIHFSTAISFPIVERIPKVTSTRRFSGSWYDQGAVDYIQKIKTTLADKTWMQAGF